MFTDAEWKEIIDSERYSDEMDYHKSLGYSQGYRDACEYFNNRLKEHKYWSTLHVSS